MSVSTQIAEFVADADEGIPEPALQAASRSVLDAIGVSLGASGLGEGCGAFLRLARASDGSGPCRILGTSVRVGPPLAALVNGAFAHALDYEDAHDLAMVHPNAAPVAAALAVAQHLDATDQRYTISGRRFLAAIAVGADLVCRLGLLLTRAADSRGWYPPPILGAIGAAATAANLLGLSPDAVRSAISLVTCQATCFGELKRSPLSVVRAVRDAFGAQGAVIAALLAADGVTGFEQPFEGEAGIAALYGGESMDAAALLDGLGERFHGTDVSFKPWPSCRGTHAFIDAALGLRLEVAAQPIASVHLVGGSANRMLFEPREQKVAPQTAIDAKFSLPFTVATALVRGRVGLADFDEAARTDADVLGLAGRVTDEVDDRASSGAEWGKVTVKLRSGRELSRIVDDPPGSPRRPIPDSALIEKFVQCACWAAEPLDAETAQGFADRLLALPETDDAVRALEAPQSLDGRRSESERGFS
ncbi:MAG: MmgE/PrpD family protein [Acidimicrobiales bacterium]